MQEGRTHGGEVTAAAKLQGRAVIANRRGREPSPLAAIPTVLRVPGSEHGLMEM